MAVNARNRSPWRRFATQLAAPMSGESLAVVRISFGFVMFLQAVTFLLPGTSGSTFVATYFQPDAWRFPLHNFEWLPRLDQTALTTLLYVLAASGLALAVGLWTRVAAAVLCTCWSYFLLVDESYFNNHYYLFALIAGLFVVMPAARCWSLDAQWGQGRTKGPPGADPLVTAAANQEPQCTIPFWPVFLLRFQLFVVYFFGGVTKLDPDWLLDGSPMRSWLSDPATTAPLRPYVSAEHLTALSSWLSRHDVALAAGWLGMLFDLAIGPMLLFRRTRLLGMALAFCFHALNHALIFDDIGLFPLMAFLATTIFLEPDWPSRLARWIMRPSVSKPDWGWLALGALLVPVVGALLGWKMRPTVATAAASSPRAEPENLSRLAPVVVSGWMLWQLILPLDYLWIPGRVNWTTEGDQFSWRMKAAVRGYAIPWIRIVDPPVARQAADGQWTVADSRWQGSTRIYRSVNARAIDWPSLPPMVVVFQSLCGERVIFNARSREIAPGKSPLEAAKEFNELWRQRYGRPAQIQPTLPLAAVIDQVLNSVPADRDGDRWRERLEDARQAAEDLRRRDLTAAETERRVRRLQGSFVNLLMHPQLSGSTRALLARVDPFALEGGEPTDLSSAASSFYAIEDPLCVSVVANNYWSYGDRFCEEWGTTGSSVYVDLDRLAYFDWQALPAVMLYAGPRQGNVVWNLFGELPWLQIRQLSLRPLAEYRYANHVADAWQSQFGRRPAVYLESRASLNHHPRQYLVDPEVDLARATLSRFGHNDWILPLELGENQNPAAP